METIEATPARGGWTRGEKLVLGAIVLFALNLFLLGLTEVQIQDRETKLDRLETSVNTIITSTDDLKSDTKVIRKVAESVGQSDEAAARQALFFQQFSEIYTEITGKPANPPTTEEQPGG